MKIDLRTIDAALLDVGRRIERRVRDAGGRAFLVGGSVRDALLRRPVVDLDLEVFDVEPRRLRTLLEEEWRVDEVGESFAVLKLRHLPIDVSLPRRERRTGAGHRDFEIAADPSMSLPDAARRRDFTINAMLVDLASDELEDPFRGRDDLERRLLRHTSERFAEDPLRVLRGMHLVARFGLTPVPETIAISATMPFADIAPERVFDEWRKLLLKGVSISLGLAFLRSTGWVLHFPELAALIECRQDPQWHPEGDVWTHTCHVMDAFAKAREDDPWEDLVVGFACLCHDFGKPGTTTHEGDRIRSRGHESAGEAPTRSFLERMTRQSALFAQVLPLVLHHLKPRQLFDARASDAAVRRLADKVGRLDRLVRVARADAGGRPPLPPGDEASDWLMEKARALEVADSRPQPLVLGRHLVARGLAPGPGFTPILDRCFDAQLDGRFTTLEEGLAYLDRLLREGEPPSGGGGGRGPGEAAAGGGAAVPAEINSGSRSS